MNFLEAKKVADSMVTALKPFCERIEIAGSIRRQRLVANDIDLVILPKSASGEVSPYGGPGQLQAIKDRCKLKCRVVTDGPQNSIFIFQRQRKPEIQLDIFFAQPETRDLLETKPTNFGSLLLCRTGSKEHNIYIVEHAKKIGLRWNPYWGVFDGHGKCLASATEEEIFAALKLDFVPPEKRER